jgi:transcriptional antiterminator RfaH
VKRWYVAQTSPRAEAVAAANLRRQGFEIYLPRYRKQRRHARKIDLVPMPLFPNYLFLAFDPALERWRSVNGTIGCQRLVSIGETPLAVPPGVVEELQAREDGEGFVVMAPIGAGFRRGAALRIVDGALTDLVGQFESLTDDQRVILLLDILGRPTRVTLPAGAVEAA